MFVPPYAAIAKVLENAAEESYRTDLVTMPVEFFRFIIGCLLAMSEFDEQAYLQAYPDVAEGVRAGTLGSAFAHFVTSGYFSGCLDGSLGFDETWYLERYPDVAAGVEAGHFPNGEVHYLTVGLFEWRAPNAAAAKDLLTWRKVLQS